MTTGVCIQTLYDLVIKKEEVDPFELTTAAEALYRSAKIVGIKETMAWYVTEPGKNRTIVSGDELSMKLRAVAGFIVTLLYRWTDNNMGRLEQHLGLALPIYVILGETHLFNNNSAGLACINVQEVINCLLTQ